MDPGLQVRSRKEFISPIRRILSFAGSILENDFQPALPGLAPLVPGKFRRNLKAELLQVVSPSVDFLSRDRPLRSVFFNPKQKRRSEKSG